MIILGVDCSLSSAGVARLVGYPNSTPVTTQLTVDRVRSVGHSDDAWPSRSLRITRQRNGILERCRNADVVVLEGPAFASNNRYAHEISWLWGLVYSGLQHMKIPVTVVPPKTVKKFVTDNGNADKNTGLAGARQLWPNLPIRNHDEADSVGLASIGAVHYRIPVDFLILERHRLAIAKLEWADITPTEVLA